MKKVREHSYWTETTIFHTVAGKRRGILSPGSAGHSDSEEQQM